MRFLASVEAAQVWRCDHPEALRLTIEEGFAIGQVVNRLRLGAALGYTRRACAPNGGDR